MTTRRNPGGRIKALEQRENAKNNVATPQPFGMEDALQQATLAMEMAVQAGDSGALTRALMMRVKLMESAPPSFSDMTDEELSERIIADLRRAFTETEMVAWCQRALSPIGYRVVRA